ncbi:acyl-CoA dehydrogenase family protein [Paenactinomyces guangxiensis]|uniref:Acyl-CoA/acyl-ACP dehydrogenase n=1 Tax=Paenactinomyces guangxiensis TaxID=1490290 RepID=A0A7W1WP29_9BACL|nr:acyl-CoA dehydrogenase family protein [Paenactinomyces guangxiensis]MBA4493463.1 acyl-CoA/acyl-ACP dehydrogenase [Paenactinomyces guangxiensis]MBH8590554.1 acyl-CoA/acyl-ACP dehydrogenase [Paenactinomyces guangxiensis]
MTPVSGFEKIQKLLDNGVHCFTVLDDKDGGSLDPFDYFRLIESLVEDSPAVALSMSMHLYTVWGLQFLFNEKQKLTYFEKVKNDRALFGSPNEPALYFVTGRNFNEDEYPIIARKSGNIYFVSGKKRFVSLEPFVKYLPVYCYVKGYNSSKIGLALFIIDKNSEGVSVTKDWNTISMKESYSNTVCFDDVIVKEDQIVFCEGQTIDKADILAYLFRLSVCSVYYGIMLKAINMVTESCKKKKVPHTNSKLSSFPGVQFTLAEMIILQETCYSQIKRFCELLKNYIVTYPDNIGKDSALNTISIITKEYVTKSAEEVVNKAMKIEGIGSIFEDNILSKLYLDIKAGLFHPPQSDVVYEILAKQKLGIFSFRRRWL